MGNTISNHLPPGTLASAEFCRVVGISRSTLTRWCGSGRLSPSRMQVGKLSVAYFTREDIDQAKRWKGNNVR